MRYEELAFMNEQLAGMLKQDIPVEGALWELCKSAKSAGLRVEMDALARDLAKGLSWEEALKDRKLPELYKQMLRVGVKSNSLPKVLTMVADYYHEMAAFWIRLKGIIFYPAMVLVVAWIFSCFIAVFIDPRFKEIFDVMDAPQVHFVGGHVLLPPALFTLALVVFLLAVFSQRVRTYLRWRLPVFKDASIAQVASALSLLVRGGAPLQEALQLAADMEKGTPAEGELHQWMARLKDGHGHFPEMTHQGRLFPPLFMWLVSTAGEDLAKGLERAAAVYQRRASYRTEMMLYAFLPLSIPLLGAMILCQITPFYTTLFGILNSLQGG